MDGLDKVLSNLNREIEGVENRTMEGLFEAGLKIQRVAQQELQSSVVTGNLRASAYTRSKSKFIRLDDNQLDADQSYSDPSGDPKGVEIGFTAVYAVFVHENSEGRSPKFLEGPLQRNKASIIDILREAGRIKG